MSPVGEATRVHTGTGSTLVEDIAGVVAGHSLIGFAQSALFAAGYRATIAGNRITVDDTVAVQYVAPVDGPYGRVAARWVIHRVDGAAPVWIVGSEDAR